MNLEKKKSEMQPKYYLLLGFVIGILLGHLFFKTKCPDMPPPTVVDTSVIDSLMVVVDDYDKQNQHLQDQVDAIQNRYVQYRLNAIKRLKDYENKIDFLSGLTDGEFANFLAEHYPVWRARRDSIVAIIKANN